MEIYATSAFIKLLEKADLTNNDLREAIDRAERDQIDGPFAGHLIKQRIARAGQGRSGGFRAILFYRRGETAVFLHLFAKSERSNLTKGEQDAYRAYAETLSKHTDADFSRLVAERGWRHITHD